MVAAGAPPLALRGYQLRARHHVAFLARRHQVTLLTLEEGGVVAEPLAEACEEVVRVPLPPWRQVLSLARAALVGDPLQAGLYRDSRLRAAFRAILARRRFDLVHVQLVRLAAGLLPVEGPPVVLDLVDALSLNLQARAVRERGPVRWAAALEARRLRRLESRLRALVDGAIVSTARDREALGGGQEVALVPNGVDPGAFPVGRGPREPGLVTFAGNLGYFPNVDGARWLIRDVWPEVRRHAPEARLRLVGARPARALQRLVRGRSDVVLTGPVPDLAVHLRAARVAVAPLRAGSGQPLKVLEAMASGTPVVATTGATAGLDARPGVHLLVADDAGAYADAIVRLLADASLAAGLATAARDLVTTRHTWDRSGVALEAVYRRVLARRSQRNPPTTTGSR